MGRVNQLKDNRKFRGLLLLVFVLGLGACTLALFPVVGKLLDDPEAFRRLILSYGSFSALVYVGFMALQVIIAMIPGEVVQIAGGYLFGTFFGSMLSLTGAILGTVITFYAARVIGLGYLKLVMDPEKLQKMAKLIHSPKAEAVMFLMFLIPGIPKDILVYAAGITPIKPSIFFVLSTLARIPAIVGSALIGAHMQQGNYVVVIAISVVSVVLFGIGYYYKDRLIQKLHDFSHKHHLPHKKTK